MQHFTFKHLTIAIAAFAAAAIALLWSWNTLAGLFGGPSAEFKHVLAAVVVATVARGLVIPRRRRLRHRT